MAWPVSTRATSDLITAAIWNADVVANMNALSPPIRKTASQTVNNSTVLVADNHLTFAIAANEVWKFQLQLFYTTNSTADIKIAIREPTSATTRWWYQSSSGGVGASYIAGGDGAAQTIPSGSADTVLIHGVCAAAGSPGSLTLAWAQGTATVVDTIILLNSILDRRQIA